MVNSASSQCSVANCISFIEINTLATLHNLLRIGLQFHQNKRIALLLPRTHPPQRFPHAFDTRDIPIVFGDTTIKIWPGLIENENAS